MRCVAVLLCLFLTALSPPQSYRITVVDIRGAEKTNIQWLHEYLDLHLPAVMKEDDLLLIRKKLLTTAVFTRADAHFEPTDGTKQKYKLVIDLDEKWTLVPVARFAYGGGTPVRIVGVYDTHSFGRLWTLGAQVQQYGNAPIGGVMWARAPRWLTGRHSIDFELWKDARLRYIYNSSDQITGQISTEALMAKAFAFAPLPSWIRGATTSNWQLGVEAAVKKAAPSTFSAADQFPETQLPSDVTLNKDYDPESSLLLNFVYDDVDIDNIEMHGPRTVFKIGPGTAEERSFTSYEFEGFGYYLFHDHLNFASHFLAGGTNSRSILDQYFLGGLDSVRGIPDGALRGTHASYMNLEIRKISHQWHYFWLQEAVFYDAGGAGPDWSSVSSSRRSSAGAGIRMIIPQIYRMVLRVDYAWSLDHPGTSGISAGVGELFQPYKPL